MKLSLDFFKVIHIRVNTQNQPAINDIAAYKQIHTPYYEYDGNPLYISLSVYIIIQKGSYQQL